MEHRILKTGFFLADGGAMFGSTPKKVWRQKYPFDEENRCKLGMNCLLVWNENRIVLLDAGVGNKELGRLSCYKFTDRKDAHKLVHSHGFEPEEVTDVVLSHLHFDHCGGCSYWDKRGNLQIAFPNATHWVSEKQWQNYLQPNALEKDVFRQEDLLPVFNAGLIRRIDSNCELFEGFYMKLFDGHTQGQIVSLIEGKNGSNLLFTGDVIPTKAHLSDEWISAYDVEPLQSLAAKIALKEWTKQKNITTIFYHDPYHLSS